MAEPTKDELSDSFLGFDSSYYQELKAAYAVAVQNGDQDRQKELIQAANELLESYINNRQDVDIMPLVSGTYHDYFEYSWWRQRDYDGTQKWCLSIEPKASYSWQEPNASQYAWNIIYNMHGQSSRWDNTLSMEKQFMCHAHFAGGWKTPWNLEPWRTNVNPFTCN